MTMQVPSKADKASKLLAGGLSRQYRKRILSTIAAIGVVVSCVYATTIWLVYANLLSSLTDCIYAVAFAWSFFWIKQGRYTLTTYWLIAWAVIQITIGSIFFVGPDTGFHLYLLVLPVMIYLLLARQPVWAKNTIMLIGVIAFIASHTLYVETYQAPISTGVAQTIFIVNVLIVFGVIFFALKFFADEIEHAFYEQEKLVQTDSLTGLFNDRYISQHASKLLSLCDRYGHPLSVMCLQIDHFSTINGVHGSEIALQTVKHVARLLARDVRDADILARTKDAHFVLLLPETVLEEAHQSAKRLREIVAAAPLPIADRKLPISLSIGLSYCESNSMLSVDHLIECADIALRQAQHEGGDLVRQQVA